jgi:uncharacterized protein (DUF2235 family)
MEPLKPFDQVTVPDGRWDICGVTYFELYAAVEKMSLASDLPEYVRLQFQQAQHLLIYSYFQFSLLSAASLQAHIAFENALRERWMMEFHKGAGGSNSIPGLNKLLKHAVTSGWIDDCSPDQIEAIVGLRNSQAHGSYMLAPIPTIRIVRTCGELIQKLFSESR